MGTIAKQKNPSSKPLSIFALVMINVIAVDSLRTLPFSAEYGFAIVFYYLLATLIFFLPTALIAAELATGWPALGGLYVWVREAFGKPTGFLTIWLQWIYNIVWFPTILAFMAATFAYLINPDLANNRWYLTLSVLFSFWGATLVNCFGMRVSSIISTLGALLGTLLPMLFIIILGLIWFFSGRPEHIQFSFGTFFPHIHHLSQLAFFTTVLFGLIGMEMSAVHAEDVKNPQRDYPRALLHSTLIILGSLILGSLAIAMVVPKNQLSLVSGLIDAFGIFFKTFHMPWMIPVIAILIILGGLSGVAAWIIGPTKGLLAASRDGLAPAWFSRTNRYDAPVNLLLLQGGIVTLLSFAFLMFPTINSAYWILSALTAQLALLVYIFMFAAAIRLRYTKGEVKRAFKLPGGKGLMWGVGGMGIVTCVAAIIIGFFPPPNVAVGNLFLYECTLITGIIVLSLPPLLLAWQKK